MPRKYEIEFPDTDELQTAVIDSIRNEFMQGHEYRNGLEDKISEAIVESVGKSIDMEVSEIVRVQLGATVQPTNEFGENTGPAIPFRKRIAELVKAWLELKVGSDGKPPTDSYYRDRAKTRAEWAIEKAVGECCGRELEKAIAKVTTELKAQVQGKVAEITRETVTRVLGLPK